MISFFIAIIALILGYIFYGKLTEKIFKINPSNITPANRLKDGVDYVPLSKNKALLIQFISIAGTGPIFGAIQGAMWGPAAFIWIVFGCIFAGAVHDYLSGMLSLRNDGATIAEVVGKYLGNTAKNVMRIFSVILLILVGAVFTTSPADLLSSVTSINKEIWLLIIVIYFIIATIIPIDKLIAKLYPIFGAGMILMAISIGVSMFTSKTALNIPEFQFTNFHPKGQNILPYLCITIACGAISGFHATQSPLIARCLKNEEHGRAVFYGAMIAEGVVALIWAAIAMSFFNGTEGLSKAGAPSIVVNTISNSLLGPIGGALAIICVAICPISSGDTAYRSARLAISDAFKIDQSKLKNRFLIAIPLFAVGISLCFIDFTIIWRYFAWANQTLATFVLWAGASYLAKNKSFHWIATIPATFMTFIVTSYILVADEGFNINYTISTITGLFVAISFFILFIKSNINFKKSAISNKKIR